MSTATKLVSLLTHYQRRAAITLLGLMVVGAMLETVGIGLVVPVLALMTQSDIAVAHPALAPWLARLGNPSHEQLVVWGMLGLVAVYGIKAVFLALVLWQQNRFVYWLQADVSQRLFSGYLRQPYTFHLQRNSAQLIRNAIVQVVDIGNVIQQGLILLTETLVLVGVSIVLVAVEPVGAVVVLATLGTAGWAFYRVTRTRVLLWGEARQQYEGLRIQHLQQGLGGAKDVKLLGREEDFIAQYRTNTEGSARVGAHQATLSGLPRLWLEFLAIIGLAALVLVMIAQGKPLAGLIPTLGLFGAAAFRVMPSVTRMIAAFQAVRFSLPVIDTVHGELNLLSSADLDRRRGPLPLTHQLTLEGVSFRYPSAQSPALQDVTLSVPRGAFVGFVGTSGAGKSTLVDVILGLLTPSGGSVNVDAVNIKDRVRDWQDQIGYVPQSIFLTDDTLRRNVAFGLASDQIDDVAVWRAIAAAQLDQFVRGLPQGLDTMVGERGIRLSGGERQRIGIARALYHDPQVLVLDEATSSLDVNTERGVMEAVRALHGTKTILVVAHRLSTVADCERLFRLDRGRLVEEGEAAHVLRAVGATS